MDWFALGTLAVGFLFGYTTKALKKRRLPLTAAQQKAVETAALKPRCLCEHWYNAHEVGGGKCMTIVEPDDEWAWDYDYDEYRRGKKKEKRRHQCACQGYIGPDPLASALWMNEGLLPNKVRPPV